MKGWIYVATMANKEGMVKIGYSDRDPDERVKEQPRATGAPGEGKVEYAAWVNDPKEFEKRVHDRLQDVRQDRKRWFTCDVGFAARSLSSINTQLIQCVNFLEQDLAKF